MYIDFTICSNQNNLCKLKELFPDATLLVSGEKLKTGRTIPYNEFSFVYEEKVCYVDDLIAAFRNYIGLKFNSLYEYVQSNKLFSSFCIVIKEEDNHPALSLSNENLLFVCKLNGNIDFDFI